MWPFVVFIYLTSIINENDCVFFFYRILIINFPFHALPSCILLHLAIKISLFLFTHMTSFSHKYIEHFSIKFFTIYSFLSCVCQNVLHVYVIKSFFYVLLCYFCV